MFPYKNPGGKSNIVAYLPGENYLIVKFRSGSDIFYRYGPNKCNETKVELLTELARQGEGLNSVLAKKDHPPFDAKGTSLQSVLPS